MSMLCPLREDLGWTLRAISIAFQDRAGQAVADIPSRARGYLVLLGVSGEVAPSQLELAQTLGLDKTRMTYLLDDLEQAGLVVRTPDPADRRARLTRLTDPGRSTLNDARRAITEVEEQLLGALEPAARTALRAALAQVAQATTEEQR